MLHLYQTSVAPLLLAALLLTEIKPSPNVTSVSNKRRPILAALLLTEIKPSPNVTSVSNKRRAIIIGGTITHWD